MAIIAVAGRKGGVGKSTVVGNLAAEFAAMGRTVAVLDADPQHSLAAWAGQGDGMLASCVQKVAGAADTLQSRARKAEKDADIVLIDTPPGMPEVGYQAALAADLLLLPCGPSPLDLFALKEALSLGLKARAERRSKKPADPVCAFEGGHDDKPGTGIGILAEGYGKEGLPPIGQRVVVAEAVAHGLTVKEYAPDSPAHEEFRALAKAVDKLLRR